VCNLQHCIGIQAIKFCIVFPQETYHFFKRYVADQKELAGPNADPDDDGNAACCFIILIAVAGVFAVAVPLINFKEYWDETGETETCTAFG
jgi:hypothetical protein